MLNVLHLDEQRGWRGGEQQVRYLVAGLAARGCRQWVAGRPVSPILARCAEVDGVTVVPLPMRGPLDLYTRWRLARLVRREGIALLHAHTSHAHGLALGARAWARQGRVVVSRRVDFAPRGGHFSRRKYRAPEAYIAVSHYIAQVLADYGVPAAQLHTVHSGIAPERFDVPPLERARLGVPEDAFLLGNVAALVGHKDHHTLLAALRLARDTHPALHLAVAGEGPLRAALEAQTRRLGLEAAVHWLGFRDDVPRFLRSCDAFVLSSREEGLGTSVLDAMAAGLPVAATAAGGIPEMVRDAQTGLLVPTSDPPALAHALVRLAQDHALRERLVREARAQLTRAFTAEAMVEGTWQVYQQVLVQG